MEKTRIGLPVGIMGALAFLLFLFAGYTPALLFVGYILIFENDSWLRKTAVKALLLALVFSALSTILGLLPQLMDLINSLLRIFGGQFTVSFIDNVYYFLSNVLSLVKLIAMALMAVMALGKKSLEIKALDKLIG